jgi:stearoyl-CoA desaturase (delta-9 desaturase)
LEIDTVLTTTDTRPAGALQSAFGSSLRKAFLILALVAPFVGTLYAIFHLHLATTTDIVVAVTLYVLCCLGITVGYHRLLTHRSFKTHAPIKFFWLVLGSMALQGPALFWAATHLKHHAHTDREGDPHSPWASEHSPNPRNGFLGFVHAHLGWMFTGGLEPSDPAYLQRLKNDKVAVWASYTFPIWLVLGLAIPYWIGGWQTFIWGTLVRVFFVHHVTWSVNSVCHVMGRRPFETTDQSRNNLLVSWLAMGEGSHNTHHAYPASARQGLEWWELDISYLIIRTMEALGLAWDVKRIPRRSLRERRVAQESAAAKLVPDGETIGPVTEPVTEPPVVPQTAAKPELVKMAQAARLTRRGLRSEESKI